MDIDDVVRKGRPDSAGWSRSEAGQRVLETVVAAASPEPGRSVLRRSLLGMGLAGVAAAAVFAVSVISAPPRGTVESAAPVGARDILLAAATRAEQEPTESGRYWHVKTISQFGPQRLECKDSSTPCAEPARFWMLRRSVTESWDASDPREASWTGLLDLGVRPYSPADERVWRSAGAPTEWTIGTDSPQKQVVSTRPGRPTLTRDPGAPRYLEDIGMLTLKQVRRLPAEQGALRTWVTSRIETQMDASAGSTTNDFLLFGLLSRMLLDTPAPPKVRAAAFRILADVPGVRSLGTVADGSGRSGQGLEIRFESNTMRLIVDPSTHRLLGSKNTSSLGDTPLDEHGVALRHPGKESSTVVLAAEWSDAAPQPPTPPGE